MEVLLAIALISMLAFLVVGNLGKFMTDSQTNIAKSMVSDAFAVPMMSFKLSVGRFPTTEEGIKALETAPDSLGERWKGPYVTCRSTRGAIRSNTASPHRRAGTATTSGRTAPTDSPIPKTTSATGRIFRERKNPYADAAGFHTHRSVVGNSPDCRNGGLCRNIGRLVFRRRA